MASDQTAFDAAYITSREICEELGINRSTLYHRWSNGTFPQPIFINDRTVTIWKRRSVRAYMNHWAKELGERRAKVA